MRMRASKPPTKRRSDFKGFRNVPGIIWALGVCGVAFIPVETHAAFGVGAIVALFAMSHFIPNAGTRVWLHFGTMLIPIVAIKGIVMGGWFTLSIFYLVFIIVPALDYLVGVDLRNHSPDEQRELHDDFSFEVLTLLVPPVVLACLTYGAWHTRSFDILSIDFWGSSLSIGAMSGILGITAGHELCHRASRVERAFGRFLLCCVTYGHFYIEHTVGHHKHVGTDEDAATSRYGESFYSFLPRVVVGEFRSACHIEAERARRKGLPFWRCEIPLYLLCSSCLCLSLTLAFGNHSILFFLVQSCVAVMLFECVNYIEHYGLERREISPGVYERVQPRHSWDSPFRVSNWCLFKLQRHADHHAHAGKRYQSLQACESAPQMPSGYATMMVLALVPPLWRAVMHPRLIELRKLNNTDQVFRHGPTPGYSQ
jgi:alkane 1-monooxygenase